MRVSSIKFRRCISMLFLALLLVIPIFFSQRTTVYARDEGQRAEISLDADMKAFKTFTVNGNTYRMAQMSGKLLRDTLGCKNVSIEAQYLCWVNVDNKIASHYDYWGWYTKKTYIHKFPVANYNVEALDAKKGSWLITMETDKTVYSDKYGKVTIDPYVSKVGIDCPSGKTATMFYINSDEIQDLVEDKYTVRGTQHHLIYTSPMTDAIYYDLNGIGHKKGWDFRTLTAWSNPPGFSWSSTASFASHYNVPIELESHDLRAQVMYRNELDIYDPDSEVGEKERAKILRVDSKTGKDSSKLSKALKGDWIGRGGSAEIKEDVEIPVSRNHNKIICCQRSCSDKK